MPLGNSFSNSTFSYSQGAEMVTGNTFFVDSGHENAAADTDGLRNAPFSSVENAFASSNVVANNGDRIIAMPGHSDTIITDGGAAFDKAGVDVIGLGWGTLRPVFIIDSAAAAAVTITADNCKLRNFEIRASFADITNGIDVSAKWFWLDNCEFTEEAADLNFLDMINASSSTANGCDGLRITNCVGTAIDASQNSFLAVVEDLDRLVFQNNFYSVDHANALASITCATGKDLTDCFIVGNYHVTLQASGDIFINNDTAANTGIVAHNRVGHADVTAGHIIVDLDGVRQFDNLSVSTDVLSGFVLPAIDVNL